MFELAPGYKLTLTTQEALQYEAKISLCGCDPFESAVVDGYHIRSLPRVAVVDLVQFLVLSTKTYSLRELKAYRTQPHSHPSVGQVMALDVGRPCGENRVLAFAKVGSSRLREALSKCWALIARDGDIITAHCTCMKGKSTVCCHVSAVLFMLAEENDRNESASYSYLNTSPVMECMATGEMDERGWRSADEKREAAAEELRKMSNLEPPSDEEFMAFLRKAHAIGADCAVFRLIPEFQSPAVPPRRKLNRQPIVDRCENGC